MVKRMFELEPCDDALELVSYNYKDDSRFVSVEIPSKFKFRKIKSISPKAFSSASFLKEIILPESVASVGAGAFEYCEALEKVSLPRGLKILDYNTFKLCTSLKSIELPEKTAVIRSFAFSGCRSLESVKLPEMLCVIYNGAFEDCVSLRAVDFPETEVTILGKAFKNCRALDALPAMYSLIGCNDLGKPFQASDLDWDTALREDVFRLASEHGSFENVNRYELFKNLIDRGLIDLMPLAENLLTEDITAKLVSYAAQSERTEFCARLLNAGKRESSPDASDEEKISDIINAKFDL